MDLSVLIPTITPRRSLLSRLLWGLTQQTGDFEILVHPSDTLGMGAKFNAMFQAAHGDYVVCVDDDDYLAPDYMATVLPRLTDDFLGYRILALQNGEYWFEAIHRGTSEDWSGKMRGVTPKCPVRTELARQVEFGDEYYADRDWSMQIQTLVESHGYIDRALYVYDWWDDFMVGTTPDAKPERWANQRQVGSWPFLTSRITWMEETWR